MDDETLAQLYEARHDDFVATRERLAAALAGAGKKDEARELKKLRRPAPTAWATNQVVRRARGAVDAFLAASDELRARQDALLAGRGDQTAYQAGVEGLRQATAAVTAAAREALAAAGRPDERPLVDGALANLRVAALSAERRDELLQARLTADLPPADDGLAALGLAGATPGPARAAPRLASVPMPPPAPKRADDEARAKAAEQERRQAEETARALADARKDEAAGREAAARADAAAREATAGREQARTRLADAEQAVTDAREALRAAEAAQREAAREQARADGEARAATRRREALERG
jgi:hypothetical protein